MNLFPAYQPRLPSAASRKKHKTSRQIKEIVLKDNNDALRSTVRKQKSNRRIEHFRASIKCVFFDGHTGKRHKSQGLGTGLFSVWRCNKMSFAHSTYLHTVILYAPGAYIPSKSILHLLFCIGCKYRNCHWLSTYCMGIVCIVVFVHSEK